MIRLSSPCVGEMGSAVFDLLVFWKLILCFGNVSVAIRIDRCGSHPLTASGLLVVQLVDPKDQFFPRKCDVTYWLPWFCFRKSGLVELWMRSPPCLDFYCCFVLWILSEMHLTRKVGCATR